MSFIRPHRSTSRTCRYLEMARTFILAVCAVALLISVQQASAGKPELHLRYYPASLLPSYMAACLLSWVLHVRSASEIRRLRLPSHIQEVI